MVRTTVDVGKMSRALGVVALSLLLVTSMLGPAFVSPTQAAQSSSVADGPEYNGLWEKSGIQDNATRSDLSSPVKLNLEQGSDEIADFSNTAAQNSVNSDLEQVWVPKEKNRGNTQVLADIPSSTVKGVAHLNGDVLVSGNNNLYRWDGSTLSDETAMGSNSNMWIAEDESGSSNIWSMSQDSTTKYYFKTHSGSGYLASTQETNDIDGLKGLYAPGDGITPVYTIATNPSGPVAGYTEDQIVAIDTDNSDYYMSGPILPGNDPTGLDRADFDAPRWVATYGSDQAVQIVDGLSNTLDEISASGELSGLSVGGTEAYYIRKTNNELVKMSLFDQWSSSSQVRYTTEYPQDEVTIKNINWEGRAPQDLSDTGQTKLQFDYSTIDSVGSGGQSFSNTVNEQQVTQDGFLDWRLSFQDYYNADYGGSSVDPEVSKLSWDYEYYNGPGSILSDPLNVADVESFGSIDIAGQSGGDNVDVELLDSNGDVVSSHSNVAPGSSVDVSNVNVNSTTEAVQVRITMATSGSGTPSVSGWKLNYQSLNPPEITDSSATIAGESTSDLSATTEVGYQDNFSVQSDLNISQVRWYVSGVEVQNESASGTGPFNFTQQWQPGQVGEQQVTVEVTAETGGIDTQSWTLQVENINAPEITGWNATVGGRTTEEVQLDTGIGSSDRFAITDISVPDNQEVQAVEWFVDQEKVLTQNAPPYEFTRTWGESDSGQVDVKAEVVGLENARSVKQWTLQIRDIGIIGESSGAASQGEVIEVRQTFRTFTGDSEEINVDVSYNEDVLRLISDNSSLSSTVTSGQSQTWEFQVTDSDYEGDPITISATQSDRTATKTFSITQRSAGGGFLPGGGGDSPLSLVIGNTWLGFLGLGSTLTYILQGVAGAGLFGLVWAQDTGRVSVPVVGRELDRLDFWIKAIGGYAVGALVAGVTIPWVALTTAALGGVYYWRTR